MKPQVNKSIVNQLLDKRKNEQECRRKNKSEKEILSYQIQLTHKMLFGEDEEEVK